MRAQFFYGTLCHLPLLQAVLGRIPEHHPASLEGHAVHWAAGESFPLISPGPGATAEGLFVPDITAAEAARLDFYEGGFGYEVHPVTVRHDGSRSAALVYMPEPGRWQPGAPWSLADWQDRWGDVAVETARAFMAHFGQAEATRLIARYPMMLTRAGARLRARRPSPASLRRPAAPADIALAAWREPYAAYFAVEEADVTFRRFSGGFSPTVTRAAFVMGDAVTVLPWDPARDRVLLVEQFRAGCWLRGDANPWSLEAIAGRIDGPETPEQAARREAEEEAGLTLSQLIPVGNFYPSPAAVTEFIYAFVAPVELPDTAQRLGGAAEEDEDIRTHVIPFERLMALIDTGEVQNGPLMLTAHWLARHRDRGGRGA